ncbi:MAG: hypothetical protein WCL16_05240, partial [bacterium]
MIEDRPDIGREGYGNRAPRRRGHQPRRAPHPFHPRVRLTPEELAAQSAGQMSSPRQGGEGLPRGHERAGEAPPQEPGYRSTERSPMFPPDGGASGNAYPDTAAPVPAAPVSETEDGAAQSGGAGVAPAAASPAAQSGGYSSTNGEGPHGGTARRTQQELGQADA